MSQRLSFVEIASNQLTAELLIEAIQKLNECIYPDKIVSEVGAMQVVDALFKKLVV